MDFLSLFAEKFILKEGCTLHLSFSHFFEFRSFFFCTHLAWIYLVVFKMFLYSVTDSGFGSEMMRQNSEGHVSGFQSNGSLF